MNTGNMPLEFVPENGSPILVVDDDTGILASIRAAVLSAGLPDPALASDSRRVMDLIRTHGFKLVLLDLIMPDLGGLDLLPQIKREFPAVECVIVTALDDVETAVEAMKHDAFDYMVKPFPHEKLIITIQRALERRYLRECLAVEKAHPSFSSLKNPAAFRRMIAADPVMARVFHQVESVAPSDYSVVITGESGTGKELLARTIHSISPRAQGPFLAVNIAAFSRNLIEDDLFGHKKGAFTGAMEDRPGIFETARGGSLFMDEITEMDYGLQGKFLRVIQERELSRLGSTNLREVDVRIITATNRDLGAEVAQGNFRADLFYRLNICHIHIPPLRERPADVIPLTRHFLEVHAARNGKDIQSPGPELEKALRNYSFPGNVRELENIIASGVLMEQGRTLSLSSCPTLAREAGKRQDTEDFLGTLAESESRHIARVMEAAGNNTSRAAEILGIGLRTLQRKLKAMNGSESRQK